MVIRLILFSWQVVDCCFHPAPARPDLCDSWWQLDNELHGKTSSSQTNLTSRQKSWSFCHTLLLPLPLSASEILEDMLSFRPSKIFHSIFFSWKCGNQGKVEYLPASNMNWPIEPFARFEWLVVFLGISCGVEATLSYHTSPRRSRQQSARDRRNFSFQCKNFHGLILSTKQTFVAWSEIYSASLPVCLSLQDFYLPTKANSEVAQLSLSGWQFLH